MTESSAKRAEMRTTHKLLIRCGIFVKYGAIAPQECAGLLAGLQAAPGDPAAIYATPDSSDVREQTRRARSIAPPAALTEPIERLFSELRPALEDHFHVTLREHEVPHYLLYRRGDFFVPHRDRPRARDTDISSRKISGVLFLNDDFSGGDLQLYGLITGQRWETVGFSCPPAPGLFVAFPSDVLHEVTPVTGGVRGTVVTWFF